MWGIFVEGCSAARIAVETGFLCVGFGRVGCGGAQITAGTDDGSGSAQNVGYTEGGLAKMEGLPYAFGRFGNVGASRFYFLAGDGSYWYGSTVSSAYSFHLGYDGSGLYPASQGYRGNGWGVRCVAR